VSDILVATVERAFFDRVVGEFIILLLLFAVEVGKGEEIPLWPILADFPREEKVRLFLLKSASSESTSSLEKLLFRTFNVVPEKSGGTSEGSSLISFFEKGEADKKLNSVSVEAEYLSLKTTVSRTLYVLVFPEELEPKRQNYSKEMVQPIY